MDEKYCKRLKQVYAQSTLLPEDLTKMQISRYYFSGGVFCRKTIFQRTACPQIIYTVYIMRRKQVISFNSELSVGNSPSLFTLNGQIAGFSRWGNPALASQIFIGGYPASKEPRDNCMAFAAGCGP